MIPKHWQKKKRQPRRTYSPQERRSLHQLRHEAHQAGATLAGNGKGGLSPVLVHTVMKRDEYQCKKCGKRDMISVHHKGGVVQSKWLSKKGHKSVSNNLATICEKCHDDIHNEARKEGIDSSQIQPEGDKE